MYNYRYKVHAG